ncbi:MAG TPA: polysaccharide deacetylase family protein [bacterium]
MIKKNIQAAAGAFIRFSGLYRLLSSFAWRARTTILVYHDPQPEVFGQHIKFLSKYHTFISLQRLVDAIYQKDRSEIPSAAVVVTIDDGHKGNVGLLPILEAFNLRPTIYLCSHIVNTHRHFWWQSGYPDPYALKGLPSPQLRTLLKNAVGFDPEREYSERQALNETEIMELLTWVEFGSHTRFHPILTNCDADECENEIRESRTCLEEFLNRPVDHFCFPNGNYGEREINLLKKHDYRSARTLEWGRNSVDADPFRLKVVEILDDSSVNLLCAQLCGFFGWFRKLLRRTRQAPAAAPPGEALATLEDEIAEASVSGQ